MNEAPNHLTMPVEEIRVRTIAALKIFPKRQIAKLMKVRSHDLTLFVQARPQDAGRRFGPLQLKRLAKICLQIETGELRHNGKMVGRGSKIWIDKPIRPALPVHRVIFGRAGTHPKIVQGEAPVKETMPSFDKLFSSKPTIVFPKLSFKR